MAELLASTHKKVSETQRYVSEEHNEEQSGLNRDDIKQRASALHSINTIDAKPQNNTHSCGYSFPDRGYCPFGGACHTCPEKIQTKTELGEVNDKYERQANLVADSIMKSSQTIIQRSECELCDDDDEPQDTIQAKKVDGSVYDAFESEANKTADAVMDSTPSVIQRQELDVSDTTDEEPDEDELDDEPDEVDTIQTKLKVNAPGDRFEREADHMADSIMNTSETTIQRSECPLCNEDEEVSGIQRMVISDKRNTLRRAEDAGITDEEAEDFESLPEDGLIMTKRSIGSQPEVSKSVQKDLTRTRGQGNALPAHTRRFMESRFGADFSNVRIHTGTAAASLNNRLKARAFTLGNDIYFGKGYYNPSDYEGKRLLAHELTHVIQQNGKRKRIQRFTKKCRKMLGKTGLAILKGKTVHQAILNDFRKKVPSAMKVIPSIPGATSLPFRVGMKKGTTRGGKPIDISPTDRPTPTRSHPLAFSGIPDLAAKHAGIMSVAEIKPAIWTDLSGQFEDVLTGASQLAKYVKEANSSDSVMVRWRAKHKIAKVIPMIPTMYRRRKIRVSGYKVSLLWCIPGLLVYKPFEIDKKKRRKKKKSSKKKAKSKKSSTKSKQTSKKTQKKPKTTKTGVKAGAYNFGLGISIMSSGGGAGNVGFGVSIMSQGASVGTVSAGIVYESQGVSAGTASLGTSKQSMGATAGTANLGKSEGDMAASAGTANKGVSKGNIAATAGQKGSGKTQGKMTAQAGGKGSKGGTQDKAPQLKGLTSGESKKAIKLAKEIDAMLQKATPAQKKLLQKIIAQRKGQKYSVPDPKWVKKVLEATRDIKESDADKLAKNVDWTPSKASAADLKKNVKQALKNDGKVDKQGDGKGTKKGGGTFDPAKLHPNARKVFQLLVAAKGLKITAEAEKLNQIIPKDITDEQYKQLQEKIKSLKQSDKATEQQVLKAVEYLIREIKGPKKPKIKSTAYDEKKAIEGNKYWSKKLGYSTALFKGAGQFKVDSADFAKFIYELQKQLLISSEGVAGPRTVIAYYQQNKLAEDAIYKKALKAIQEKKKPKKKKKGKKNKAVKENLAKYVNIKYFLKYDKKTRLYSLDTKKINRAHSVGDLPVSFNNGMVGYFDQCQISIQNKKITIDNKETDVQIISGSFNFWLKKVPKRVTLYKKFEDFSRTFKYVWIPSQKKAYGSYELKIYEELDKLTYIKNDQVKLKSGATTSPKDLGEIKAQIHDIVNVKVQHFTDGTIYYYKVDLTPKKINTKGVYYTEGQDMIFFKRKARIKLPVQKIIRKQSKTKK